jgi:hypothetical protein
MACNAPNHLDACDDGQNDEPEPEEDIDLLVDDVEREDAETVELLDGAGGAELVKGALGDLKERKGYILVAKLQESRPLGRPWREDQSSAPARGRSCPPRRCHRW